MSAVDPSQQPAVAGGTSTRTSLVDRLRQERSFLALIAVAFLVSGATSGCPMWRAGFLLAGYAAVANDSIQTIGTFIASNKDQPWWKLWLFIGGIFLATVVWSWVQFDGDVTYQRLAEGPAAPTEFSLSVSAPVFLIILTRLKMPVSTTLLLLSFAEGGIGKVLMKSFMGYGLAFAIAIVVWLACTKAFERWFTGTPHPGWRVAQWLASGLLWSVLIQQDAANIAVYLPRQLTVVELIAFSGVIFVGLGILFRMGGERIQQSLKKSPMSSTCAPPPSSRWSPSSSSTSRSQGAHVHHMGLPGTPRRRELAMTRAGAEIARWVLPQDDGPGCRPGRHGPGRLADSGLCSQRGCSRRISSVGLGG